MTGRPEPNRCGIAGWVLFDWASQPFYTLILTFLFAPYFANVFIGDPVEGQALWGLAIGIAAAIVALLSPVLGAMADAGGRRKQAIALFSVLMVVGMVGLWIAEPEARDRAWMVLGLFGLAYVATELATVFNNAMMTGLTPSSRLGRLSGNGWAVGYLGGLASLLIVVGLLAADPKTGLTALGIAPLLNLDASAHEADRLVGPFSALWYAIFILPFFLFTPDLIAHGTGTWRDGLTRLLDTARNLRNHANAAWFLLARMLYADGLAAILAFGGIYAASVFGWGAFELGLFGIILTITGAIGCVIGGRLDDALGSKTVIVAAIVLLLIGSLGVLSVDRSHVLYVVPVDLRLAGMPPFASPGEQIYLAFTVLLGLAVGPVQSASRSLMARLAPADRMTEFFGLFAFSGKATAFAAPLAVSAVTAFSGSQRLGIATAALFLLTGLVLLIAKVRSPRLVS